MKLCVNKPKNIIGGHDCLICQNIKVVLLVSLIPPTVLHTALSCRRSDRAGGG